MNNIFRVPVDNQHFKDTIENGKRVDEIARYLDPESLVSIQRIAKDGIVRYWGSLAGEANRRTFERLSNGDELLCYRSGKYISLARIVYKTINRDLAIASWGLTEKKTSWELIYFLDEVVYIQLNANILNKELAYGAGPVMGFSRVQDEKVKRFILKHSSLKSFVTKHQLETNIIENAVKSISRQSISSPFEAQYYLVDLGNQLGFETYVPPSDGGRSAFGMKLGELVTLHKDQLIDYAAPIILDPLSNIDVIWFKNNYTPHYCYEVIHATGMKEAFARLKAVADHYENAKTRIIGSQAIKVDFDKSRRLYFPNSADISYKLYEDLIKTHAESSHFKKVINSFLN